MASQRASTSPGGTTRPSTPCRTVAPHDEVAITGSAVAIASVMTSPHPSDSEGSTQASLAANQRCTSRLGTEPTHR
jgi:hypothetical protein